VRLAVVGTFPRTSKDPEGYDGRTLHYFAARDLRALLERNGFSVAWAHGIFCRPRWFARLPDSGPMGTIKREFFSGEVFVAALKAAHRGAAAAK
jgi:hypothetical protein